MTTADTATHTAPGAIASAALAEFGAGLRGTAVLPGEVGNDEARSIWNGAHDPHRDPSRQPHRDSTGRVHLKDLEAGTQQFGLAVTGGLVSSTGIAGFTTVGGIGWLMRKHGLACDNLIGAHVVTADGQFVHASPIENTDLFWGLRGGGGNFGVVTSCEYQLHEVGATVFSGLAFYPAEEAEQSAGPIPGGVRGSTWRADLPTHTQDGSRPSTRSTRAGSTTTSARRSCRGRRPCPARAAQESFARLPNPLAEIHLQHLGGAVGRVPAEETAYALRDQSSSSTSSPLPRTPTVSTSPSPGREASRRRSERRSAPT